MGFAHDKVEVQDCAEVNHHGGGKTWVSLLQMKGTAYSNIFLHYKELKCKIGKMEGIPFGMINQTVFLLRNPRYDLGSKM